VTVIAIFTTALIIDYKKTPREIVVGTEAIGAMLLTIGAWLGGTLTFRNQIGVDHRYAGAGKWKEEYIKSKPGEKVIVAKSDELQANQMKLVHINNKRIVIGKTETKYVAFDDFCTHRGGSLAGGSMICATVQCPWHGSQFDVSTGDPKAGPATKKISTYQLTEEGGNIYLTAF
jgi:nitrite reductase/ring-hydroxylating ferredoxin subunit